MMEVSHFLSTCGVKNKKEVLGLLEDAEVSIIEVVRHRMNS